MENDMSDGAEAVLVTRDELAAAIRKAVEAMPYPWAFPGGPNVKPGTLREFFENTWQGHYADDVFQQTALVAADAALDALFGRE